MAAVGYFHTTQLFKNYKNKCERLLKLGVLKKYPNSRYSSPSFIIYQNDKTARFVSDFRKLNKELERAPTIFLRVKIC